jgi:uncharacterized membrane protein
MPKNIQEYQYPIITSHPHNIGATLTAPAAGGTITKNTISMIIYVILLILVLILIYHVILYIKLKNNKCSDLEIYLNMAEVTH